MFLCPGGSDDVRLLILGILELTQKTSERSDVDLKVNNPFVVKGKESNEHTKIIFSGWRLDILDKFVF